jgi:hypothetical protein
MRVAAALFVVIAIASVSSMLAWGSRVYAQSSAVTTGAVDTLSGAARVPAPGIQDKTPYLSTISKTIADEASRLRNDAAGWNQKLQELEVDIDKAQDVETMSRQIEECLVVLRAGADRVAPKSEARVSLRKQEGALRDLASRAEVHSDPGIRKTAGYFQQKTTELHELNRSMEETRIRLIGEIDRLEKVKVQIEFNRGGGQIGESVKAGQATLNTIQAIAGDTQRLATDLDTFGRTPAASAPSSASPTTPPAAAKPPDSANPAEARKRR